MKKILIATAVGLLVAGHVAAQEGPWLVRARAVHLQMVNDASSGLTALGLTVDNKNIPELDISYFFNKNVAAELILTVPQEQTVSSNGTSIGNFKHLPPTLTLQYHFTELGGYKPYVGAGVNYTKISSVSLASPYSLGNHSWGGALQAGVDIPLDKQWSLNFDVKKVYLRADVFSGTTNAGVLRLDPTLVGVGVGYRF